MRFVRNPDWTRDEIVLVCAAVVANDWKTIPQEDQRAIDLSRLLQSPAIHPLDHRWADFRNPAGVERKTSDIIITRHPDYRGHPTNGNRLDIEVVRDFRDRPDEMRALAAAIRETLRTWDGDAPELPDPDLDDPGGEEGGVLLKQHQRRERDPALKRKKIADAKRRGVLIACEVCEFDFHRTYGARGLDYIECHHRIPLNVSGRTRTQIKDLALICSNCHRMIHRTRQWLTVEDLHAVVAARRLPGR